MMRGSFLFRTLSLANVTCKRDMGKLGFWWGHITEEDLTAAARKQHEMRVINWQDGESVLDGEVKTATYTPLRVEKEENAIKVGYDLDKMTITDFQGWGNRKRGIGAMIKKPHLWAYDRRVDAYTKQIKKQKFMRDRLMALGPDLSAAHFLISSGMRLKFKDGDGEWWDARKLTRLPTSYEKGWYVESVDASDSQLIYEGIQNIRNLIYLKHLNVSYCEYIDSFCLDRITGEFQDSLEELDLSGCKMVDMSSLECLWRLRNLKVLTLKDMKHVEDLKLLCLMLLEEIPDLEIRGVDYFDTSLLKGTEHEYLLKEFEQMLLEPGQVSQPSQEEVLRDFNTEDYVIKSQENEDPGGSSTTDIISEDSSVSLVKHSGRVKV